MAYIGQSIKNGTFTVLDTSGNTYNGSNTAFNLGTQVGSPAQLLVSHDGVIQKPGTDYTLSSGGAAITFTTAPASGAAIFIVEISGAVGGPMNTDINGSEFILDVDGDTSITADTDDQIDIKVGGTDVATLTNSNLVLKGTTPKLTIGDAGAENTAIVFDGNAQDYYIGLEDSSDRLRIGAGSVVGNGSGIGITSTGVTQIINGLAIGGTGTANTLDDYEEGTFTPTFTSSGGDYSISYSSQQGKYTKIGQTVICHFLVIASGTPSGGSGDFRLAGLPFTPADTNVIAGGHGMIGIANNLSINVDAVQLLFNLGSSSAFANLMLLADNGSVTSTSNAGNAIIHNSAPRIDGTLVYRTAS